MKTKGRYRRTVFRGGRRYVVCGLRVRPALEARGEPSAGMWLPGATLAFVLIFSAYLIGRPPAYSVGLESMVPHADAARYTINDFANARR